MKNIKDLLPRNKNIFDKDSLIEEGDCVKKLKYRSMHIEEFDKIINLRQPFEMYYNKQISSEDKRNSCETIQGNREISFYSGLNHSITMGIDSSKRYIYFNYRKENKKIKNLVKDFVSMLVNY